jgi:hypothetical protein
MNRVIIAGLLMCSVVLNGACTLLLPTDQLVQECTVPEDCGEGFVCDQNACLPEDTEDTGQ